LISGSPSIHRHLAYQHRQHIYQLRLRSELFLLNPMRRAAIRAFRTARLTPLRALRSRNAFQSSNCALGVRLASSQSTSAKIATPEKSMYFRRISVALVSSLVGYGAWYTYKGNGTDITSGHQAFTSQQTRTISTDTEAATAISRKAVVVGPDTLYTGEISGDGPISKDTDESGRKVLEMLTPDQATQKLRRNEESYFVGRGKGVVRYDVVQIPSNDPIEDDHSEKIIELPQSMATASDPVSDWMFWGVFDGHS